MADDLEAFLRQVAQRRAGTGQPAGKPGPAAGQAANKRPPTSEPAAGEIVDAEAVAPDPVPLSREMGHWEQTGSPRKGAGRSGRGRKEAKWDSKQMEAHVHQTFDHHVGALDDGPGMPAPGVGAEAERPAAAAEIARLLAHPQSLKNAIVLSEILSPPHIRW